MLLTAAAVVVGSSVMLADPIFQGLAVSLIFGEVAALPRELKPAAVKRPVPAAFACSL
jgi:hypothetical protein